MEIRRRDSFLWGRAPIKLPPEQRKQQEIVQSHRLDSNDDTQRLKPDVDHVTPDERSANVKEQNKSVMRCRKFLRGKKKFNMDPKKGVQYLVENSLLEKSPPSVATFLYKEEGLNKTAIGNFLGEREEFHLETLKAFVDLHEFSDLNLVQALRTTLAMSQIGIRRRGPGTMNRDEGASQLSRTSSSILERPTDGGRQFLWSFRLPGEAQKIDRMMEAFASRYCNCNPGVFQSTDTCYILSFAIIMLNTSLHNPNVKDKPSLQCFISMTRGINNGANLSAELLTKLYASIRSEPFKIPEDDGNDLTLTFFNPDREGWLLKMGGRVKTWKRRWFILTDSCLYYFEYTTDKDPIGIIPLEDLCVRTLQDAGKPFCLELFNPNGEKIKSCKTENKGRVVQGKHQSYKLSAGSQNERDSWIDAISASVTRNPFSDLMFLRRKKVIGPAPPPLS